MLAFAEVGQYLIEREASQANQRVAHAAVGRVGVEGFGPFGVGGRFEERQLDIERAGSGRGGSFGGLVGFGGGDGRGLLATPTASRPRPA
ncbi:hypothetical protein [Hymenobacter siberiensis]|uniref:hypothetical protein n=1 Tax=Hymenobacter siberiensis TaxID=2848396 RepID=UPI001D00DB79|nr:hypothetical protein [Hymenobacter siberiensis]